MRPADDSALSCLSVIDMKIVLRHSRESGNPGGAGLEEHHRRPHPWIPAFAGMTGKGCHRCLSSLCGPRKPRVIPGVTRNPREPTSGRGRATPCA